MVPELSSIALTLDPSFPIIERACEYPTKNVTELSLTSEAFEHVPLPSMGYSPVTRLNTSITASIAGDNRKCGCSFADIST